MVAHGAVNGSPDVSYGAVTDAQSNGLSPYLRLLPMLLGIGLSPPPSNTLTWL